MKGPLISLDCCSMRLFMIIVWLEDTGRPPTTATSFRKFRCVVSSVAFRPRSRKRVMTHSSMCDISAGEFPLN